MHKKKFNSLAIVIPSFNEKKNFNNILKKINKKYNLLIIDDCSSDGTSSYLKKNKIFFIRNNKNLGYEKSLIKVFLFLIKLKKIKYILTMDADGQHKISYIEKMLSYLTKNKADIIIGSRLRKNRFIEKIISKVFKMKYDLSDPLSGFKLYRTEVIKKIDFTKIKKHFLVDIIIQALNKNFKISNINIKTKLRKDKPRVGNLIYSNLKMINILFSIIYTKK